MRKKIEMRFAQLPLTLRLGRSKLRGPQNTQDAFVLAAIAQNLRRHTTLVARPPFWPLDCSGQQQERMRLLDESFVTALHD
jgi:hypothetical protein